ncbi:hypothetical protein OEZ71_13170 [Defluviimonas sp. WL0050]|uniref:Uncharacterized protein n=1 Tax=Albidovulum litorale TaxID=2984134 RepID=A0ABT2ZQ13_9RHOB|nr:hypothetical protein [Defluviimonas sp. WL0050]MCV2873246.1 hypothetical protein [Defluviimonas sp. WL0050]
MTTISLWTMRGLALLTFVVLAGCETPDAGVVECEEGVSDLSRMADVTPPAC